MPSENVPAQTRPAETIPVETANDAPAGVQRRTVVTGLAVGGGALLLSQVARAQTATPAPAAVKITPLSKLTKDFATAEFMFGDTAALLVRLSGPPTDKARALEVKVGGKPVYLSAFTRVCTHLGCKPALPDAKTHLQVCPCHGSAYSADGTVVRGPAKLSLGLLKLEVRGSDVWAVALAPAPAPAS
ncbi:ubiquinol-cytochrome c reductase iron-sulfur subunit [Deinococcus sp.]|uniref:QcrA and Rieske domain-containing protein n=1 Tax=Deinococcus sp. TaxID=47478 RepID=UPI0025F39CBD|nr:ubiquinol-cytochrome c reductase iron-sulfur subunit [Deinococcus sp.]